MDTFCSTWNVVRLISERGSVCQQHRIIPKLTPFAGLYPQEDGDDLLPCCLANETVRPKKVVLSTQHMPVLVAPPRSRGRQNPHRSTHPGPRRSARRRLAGCVDPQSPFTCSGTSPRYSLCPAKTTTRIRAGKHPHRGPARARAGRPGDVAGSTQGSCTATSAPAAIAASRNGSAGVFRASSESLMNAQPRSAIF